MVPEVSSAAAFAAALKQTLKRMPRGSQYPGVKEYVAKTINDGDIYAQAHKFFDEILANYVLKRR